MRLILMILMVLPLAAAGQNRVNFSQYMHNHQIFNPAYMEYKRNVGGSMLYRMQWMGFEGSPRTLIGHGYYNVKNHGFSLQLLNDQITIFKHLEIGLSYSYSVKLDRYTNLSFGLKATYNQQSADYGSLSYFDAGDQTLSGSIRKIGVNFGGGVFLRSKNYYASIGAPYLFNNKNISQNTMLFNDIQYNHFYITGGYKLVDNFIYVLYPTALVKWTKGSPLAAGVDMNLIWNERIWGGLGYRIDNTVVFSAGVIIMDQFKAIYSYDLGLGRVNKFGGMTHEISIGYGMELYRSAFSKRKFTTRKMTLRKKARYN